MEVFVCLFFRGHWPSKSRVTVVTVFVPHLLWFLCFVWNSAPATIFSWFPLVWECVWCWHVFWAICSSFFSSLPPPLCSFLLTQGNLKWCHWVSTTVCFPTKTYKAKRSSLHKEDHISHMCELKLRLLLCSFFWAVFKMLYSRAEVKAWWVCVCACVFVNVVYEMKWGISFTSHLKCLLGIHMLI